MVGRVWEEGGFGEWEDERGIKGVEMGLAGGRADVGGEGGEWTERPGEGVCGEAGGRGEEGLMWWKDMTLGVLEEGVKELMEVLGKVGFPLLTKDVRGVVGRERAKGRGCV